MHSLTERLSRLPRRNKIAFQIVFDAGLIGSAFLLAIFLRLESIAPLGHLSTLLLTATLILATVALFYWVGLYKTLVRFVTGNVLRGIGKAVVLSTALLIILARVENVSLPRSVPFIYALLLYAAIGSSRFIIRDLFNRPMKANKKPVVIYGAGVAGLELLNSLANSKTYQPVAFVDDSAALHNLTIGGLRVYAPNRMHELAQIKDVQVILLAIPSASRSRKQDIVKALSCHGFEIKTIPSIADIIAGKATIAELRDVTPEDLLGREPVLPDTDLLQQNITDKVVMVTGAGGSIGSELCRQILAQGPAALVMFEISEYALYSICTEIEDVLVADQKQITIHPVLGSVQNAEKLAQVVKDLAVETLFHAAAYKHVPLVEENIVEAVQNNIFGTHVTATVAREHGVQNFILISTDKAVRPTNVMGASKRVAELICQAYALEPGRTTFSMVRFGNVLGSSGSVIPRFKAQIESGGPVTVTHPDINRFFMTIPEASQLVIQAGALAKGGDVFVLDMGEPVKIVDLAKTMIRLHGLEPYVSTNCQGDDHGKHGDVEIVFTGLRRGEKLYEELLIGNDPKETHHPRIMSASEASMQLDQLNTYLARLADSCRAFDAEGIVQVLKELPLDYAPMNAANLTENKHLTVSSTRILQEKTSTAAR